MHRAITWINQVKSVGHVGLANWMDIPAFRLLDTGGIDSPGSLGPWGLLLRTYRALQADLADLATRHQPQLFPLTQAIRRDAQKFPVDTDGEVKAVGRSGDTNQYIYI